MSEHTAKPPRHLWVVGVLAVLWNAIGAFDYSATHLRLESYLGAFTPEQLEYFYNSPAWTVAAWASAVWGALAFSAVIWVTALFLFLHARAMAKRGVLA